MSARTLGAIFLLAVPAPLLAQQQTPLPPGAPSDPYARPDVMDQTQKDMESGVDQLRRAVRDAAIENAVRQGQMGRARPAKAAEVAAGTALHDKTGASIGTVDKVEPDGAVIATAAGKVKVPLEAFGVNKKGLLVDLTKTEFDALVAQANGGPHG